VCRSAELEAENAGLREALETISDACPAEYEGKVARKALGKQEVSDAD